MNFVAVAFNGWNSALGAVLGLVVALFGFSPRAHFLTGPGEVEGLLLPDRLHIRVQNLVYSTLTMKLILCSLVVRFLPVNFPLLVATRLSDLSTPGRSAAWLLVRPAACAVLFAAYRVLLPVG